MRRLWMRWLVRVIGALLLGLSVGAAQALDTSGASCQGNGCRAGDGRTGGGSCAGNYCAAGSAGTIGGDCVGLKCQAGNGGNTGGNCVGDYCIAGSGSTIGGNCTGKGCRAGQGGTRGGTCTGEGCQPGANRGEVVHGEVVENIGCCVAWVNEGVVQTMGRSVAAQCNALQSRNRTPGKCDYVDKNNMKKTVEPDSDAQPNPLPAAPTSIEEITKQAAHQPDPRCPFTCQFWFERTKSCVGARSNRCTQKENK